MILEHEEDAGIHVINPYVSNWYTRGDGSILADGEDGV